ncbi:MAG: glycoside hydrolase N-terminal domain-containing protein, partial [Phycisphaerales bacterium]
MTGAMLALVISAVAAALAPTERMPDLWYARPANNWNEALPVGNGRLGAMVFGGTARERLQLNEASVWEGNADDRNAPEAAASFRAARELALAGKVVEAQRILQRDCMLPGNMLPRSHQTLGDLWIELVDAGAGTDAGAGAGAGDATADGAADASPDGYRRSLDLRTGVATTAMMLGDVRIEREVFASAPDELLVVRVQAPGGTLPA